MQIDKYGQIIYTENDLCEVFYTNPNKSLKNVFTETKIKFPDFIKVENFLHYSNSDVPINEFDKSLQKNYFFPDKYKTFDIIEHVVSLCKTDIELDRVGVELSLFVEYDMLWLLVYLKYFIDITKEKNIVIGVGRGSSVSSYVLYLLGVHKIDSLKYNLSIEEFFKGENYES